MQALIIVGPLIIRRSDDQVLEDAIVNVIGNIALTGPEAAKMLSRAKPPAGWPANLTYLATRMPSTFKSSRSPATVRSSFTSPGS